MAESIKFSAEGIRCRCTCLNPAWKYLEGNLITKDVIQTLSASMKGSKVRCDSQPVSIMYTGGTIRPLMGGKVEETVKAIGFHDGRVVAAGSKARVVAQMGKRVYETVELTEGQTLLPGLIEPHVHIVATAMMMAGWNDFGPFEGQYLHEEYTPEWLKEQIANVKASPMKQEDFWILGHSLDPSLMPFTVNENALNELQRWDCDAVDEIENEIPVMMMSASGHTAYVNTEALRIIYDHNKPDGYDSFEEFRDHVNSGGGLQELAEIGLAFTSIPPLQLLESVLGIKKGLDSLFDLANQRGVTLLYDAAMSSTLKTILDTYLLTNRSTVRIGFGEICDTVDGAKKLDSYKPPDKFHNLYMGSIKVISDGSNQGLTGYQHEVYRCKPEDNTGLFNFEEMEFNELVKIVIDKGWPMMIHGNGNKAIEKILTAYEKALGGKSGLKKGHRIEHCSLPSEDSLKRMAKLGISPSFLIGHVGYWGNVFQKGILEDKAALLDPCRSALDKGMRISLHSDYFVSPLGPLRMVEQAVTRIMEQDPNRGVLNNVEKITPAQALKAVTYDAAWQCQADEWIGSLEKGKMADYVILDEDPITRKDPVGMRNIRVLETWVEGINVYK